MEHAFAELKEALCTSPVLAYLDYEKQFIVATDASSKKGGVVLSQLDEKGRENPTHYASRTRSDAEKN